MPPSCPRASTCSTRTTCACWTPRTARGAGGVRGRRGGGDAAAGIAASGRLPHALPATHPLSPRSSWQQLGGVNGVARCRANSIAVCAAAPGAAAAATAALGVEWVSRQGAGHQREGDKGAGAAAAARDEGLQAQLLRSSLSLAPTLTPRHRWAVWDALGAPGAQPGPATPPRSPVRIPRIAQPSALLRAHRDPRHPAQGGGDGQGGARRVKPAMSA